MLAPGNDAVYVLTFQQTQGTIESLPLAGGPASVLATSQPDAEYPVTDGAYLYWVTFAIGSSSIMTLPLSGGTPTTLVSSADVGGAYVDVGFSDASASASTTYVDGGR